MITIRKVLNLLLVVWPPKINGYPSYHKGKRYTRIIMKFFQIVLIVDLLFTIYTLLRFNSRITFHDLNYSWLFLLGISVYLKIV